jgi:hypothetical protein
MLSHSTFRELLTDTERTKREEEEELVKNRLSPESLVEEPRKNENKVLVLFFF